MKFIYAAIALVLGVTPGFAADISAKDISPAARPAIYEAARTTFSGGYIGASVNWDRLDVDQNASLDWSDKECLGGCERRGLREFFGTGEVDGTSIGHAGFSDSAISGGVRAGYHFRVGRLYGGPVLALDFGGVEASDRFSVGDGDWSGRTNVSVNWTGTLAGKLGVAVTERVGVYALAGWTLADVDASGKGKLSDGTATGGFSTSDTLGGFTYGAGVDVYVTDQLSLFAEWTRTDLGGVSASGTGAGDLDCIGFSWDGDVTLDRVKAGLAYHF